jgi:hypothetical protein
MAATRAKRNIIKSFRADCTNDWRELERLEKRPASLFLPVTGGETRQLKRRKILPNKIQNLCEHFVRYIMIT